MHRAAANEDFPGVLYQKFIEDSCECVSRHYRENGNPEGFEMSGFRIALPRTIDARLPGMTFNYVANFWFQGTTQNWKRRFALTLSVTEW
jgi:hypothetical protein